MWKIFQRKSSNKLQDFINNLTNTSSYCIPIMTPISIHSSSQICTLPFSANGPIPKIQNIWKLKQGIPDELWNLSQMHNFAEPHISHGSNASHRPEFSPIPILMLTISSSNPLNFFLRVPYKLKNPKTFSVVSSLSSSLHPPSEPAAQPLEQSNRDPESIGFGSFQHLADFGNEK